MQDYAYENTSKWQMLTIKIKLKITLIINLLPTKL